jgi:SAM-dependent methyltransferase
MYLKKYDITIDIMDYYDKNYFDWQKNIGNIGGFLNKFKFDKLIDKSHKVLDFGCGGGYLLKNIDCAEKIGLEINNSTHSTCIENGVIVFDTFENMPNKYHNYFDVIISNHALEHVQIPINILKNLYSLLKPMGILIIVLPCEQPGEEQFYYKENDINQHLHTWCPQTIGNLVKLAGFKIVESINFQHQWTPDFQTRYLEHNYHKDCEEYAKKNGNQQLRCVGVKI